MTNSMGIFSKKANLKTPKQRKQESIKILKAHGIKTMSTLPLIEGEDEVEIRSKEEVTKRAIGLLLISLYAEGLANTEEHDEHKEWLEKLINKYSAYDFFSMEEKSFLENSNPTQSEIVQFSWQYEPLAVLLWALGFLNIEESLGIPATICDVPKLVNAISSFDSYDEVFGKAILRGKEEILDQADLIYRYDWSCVNECMNNPEGNKIEWGIVMERHKALNWLINYGYDSPQDWDDVTTDT